MSKTYKATLRMVDGFQEVVLPPEIHLENDEYFIRRDEISGNVILSTEPEQHIWKEFMEFRDAHPISDEEWEAFDEALSEARGRPMFVDH